MRIFKIQKNKASKSILFLNQENGENLAFSQTFQFYPSLDYHKIRTRTNFENPNAKSLDLHLVM